MKKEKCIMPQSKYWGIERDKVNNTRHEIFDAFNRQHSISEGLVIFIPLELHNLTKYGFQYNKEIKEYMKWVAMNAWCKINKKTEENFYQIFHEYALLPVKTESEIFEALYKKLSACDKT